MREGQRQPRRKVEGYTISAVSERYGLHPQTLRMYEREGLLLPSRSVGNTRYYNDRDLERLEMILTLTRDMGVNLAGVEVILNLREQFARMQEEMAQVLEAVQSEFSERLVTRGQRQTVALVPRSAFAVLSRDAQPAVRRAARRSRQDPQNGPKEGRK
jgi:MerR family transcriptional regulator, heat shock protein HspR